MSRNSTNYRVTPLIRGEWRESSETIDIEDLADGGRFAEMGAAGPSDADDALAAAERAGASLRDTTVPQRATWCETIAMKVRDRREELAEVVVREAGKPISSARSEADAAAERFDRAAEEIRALNGEFRRGTTAGHDGWEAMVKYEPMGVTLCITPYNYPLATSVMMIAPALAAGNSVVMKPSSKTPVSGQLLAEILSETTLPPARSTLCPGGGVTSATRSPATIASTSSP